MANSDSRSVLQKFERYTTRCEFFLWHSVPPRKFIPDSETPANRNSPCADLRGGARPSARALAITCAMPGDGQQAGFAAKRSQTPTLTSARMRIIGCADPAKRRCAETRSSRWWSRGQGGAFRSASQTCGIAFCQNDTIASLSQPSHPIQHGKWISGFSS
jgi:hypothetical protein